MVKKLLMLVAIMAVAVVGVGGVASASVVQPEKVTICHRHNSVENPYNKESVSVNSADGDATPPPNDHSHHTGPVVTSVAEAQALKDQKTKWGDIIPPHGVFAGLNWTTEGQEVYNNGCKYTSEEQPPEEEPEEGEVLGGTSTKLPTTGGLSGETALAIVAVAGSTLAIASGAGTRLASRFLK
ncbi:MAG TPA: hypothetical protein VJJ78_04275 [Candidatus Saccharimonadales bacterium]|nr:hypothetical protein [Candidatus Saccharimonadales bacterium]